MPHGRELDGDRRQGAAVEEHRGGRSAFVTALPRHEIAEACIRSLKALDIDTSHLVRTDSGRLGLYFVETGANQRPSTVIYDRSGSAVSRTPPEAYDWEAVFADAGWLLPLVDVVIGNEGDAEDVLGIKAGDSDVEAGSLRIDKYPEVARRIVERFPNVGKVAITLRESISASHNNWGAMLYDAADDAARFAPLRGGTYRPYEIRDIVDRVGGGDSSSSEI